MRMTWVLPFAAAVFGYCLAVTLSMSLAFPLLAGWRGMVAELTSLDPDLLQLVIVPAGFHFIAGGIYLLARPRLRLQRADWPRTARVAFAVGGLVWWGPWLIGAMAWFATGMRGANLSAMIWYASAPICFAAGVVTAESLALAVSPPDRGQRG